MRHIKETAGVDIFIKKVREMIRESTKNKEYKSLSTGIILLEETKEIQEELLNENI
jgi:hypothetical protein